MTAEAHTRRNVEGTQTAVLVWLPCLSCNEEIRSETCNCGSPSLSQHTLTHSLGCRVLVGTTPPSASDLQARAGPVKAGVFDNREACALTRTRAVQKPTHTAIAEVEATSSPPVAGTANAVPPAQQFAALLHRNALTAFRDVSVLWLRLGAHLLLALALGTVFLRLDASWNGVVARSGLLFFVTASFTHQTVSSLSLIHI